MASFKKTNVKIFAKTGPELSPDNIYWKQFTAPVLVKEFGPIDYIDFSPIEPHYFAVTSSARVQVYNPITKLVEKNLSRFKKNAYGGSFRSDGKLLCAGGEEHNVRLFDFNSKNLLRLFKGHTAPVHRTFFTSDGIRITSFSDDNTVALWDIPSEKQLITFNKHTDYIRAGAVSPVSPDIFLSGSYDKHIQMYDTRTNKTVFTVDHEAPVESLLFLPSGGVFVSAGGTEIRVWDALAGGRLQAKVSQHHKTVTCLKLASNGRRIVSGSLDRHVKIYDAGTYKVVHTLDYPNAVLSVGVSGDDETVVAGMVDGMLSVRRRDTEVKESKTQRKKVSYRYADSHSHVPSTDAIVQEETKEVMSKQDAFLRKFQYSKALDSALLAFVVNKTPHVTVALFQELTRRQGLKQALAGRDGKSLSSILRFLIRHIGNVRFGKVLLHVTSVLVDVYEENLEELNDEARVMFNQLAKKLEEEENLTKSLLELQGALQMLVTGAETVSSLAVQGNQPLEASNAALTELVISIG
ncbi:U3 small nucleolar RNA-associated protein 15 homolog [Diprion similis]|uniref:U3 small nucleolar RNA-associated protein 15 homolog n=1 Tax=Diprion similis TaxID=362088 RepID=UPI001EF8AB9B|nr:U3 small nucleolar RNA-associated protein 15 homolog [Diprion similis]